MNLRLVKVIWNDAWANKDDEVSLEDIARTHAPVVVTTIGWYLYEDKEGLSVANEMYETKFRGRTFIPKPLIVSIEDVLQRKQKRKVNDGQAKEVLKDEKASE